MSIAELYEKYRHQFAFIESLNVGKPYFESFNFDLKQTIECFRYFAVRMLPDAESAAFHCHSIASSQTLHTTGSLGPHPRSPGLGRQEPWQDHSHLRRQHLLHRERAARCGGPHPAVELPAAAPRLEARPVPRHW